MEVTIDQTNDTKFQSLGVRWKAFHQKNPELRIRDAAEKLSTTELALLATGVTADVTRLQSDWMAIIQQVAKMGPVMALTRNESAVHEKTGVYENLHLSPSMGLALGKQIDQRFIFKEWCYGFASIEKRQNGLRYSLHFFDAHGVAVHKIYLTNESNLSKFDELINEYAAPALCDREREKSHRPPTKYLNDGEVDVESLSADWAAMNDVHAFHGMLKRHQVERQQAFRLVGKKWVRRVDVNALRRVLTTASETGLSIMVFVGNPGNIQIHTGPVNNIVTVGPWINVLDSDFSLHLLESDLATAWVVTKPNSHGVVTSLELFDVKGQVIAYLFGEREQQSPENPAWRELMESLD